MKNNELINYMINISADYLCKCEFFKKNYGKEQVVNILKKKIKCVYTDIDDKFSRGGYLGGTITLNFIGSSGKIKKEDIENNEFLRSTMVHECIHAFFSNNLFERIISGYPGKCGGLRFMGDWIIGIGMDEGYTEWIKTKTKCSSEKTLRYNNLVNIFNQLETIFGENTVMSMANLKFKEMQTLFKLSKKDFLKFYDLTDELKDWYWYNLMNSEILRVYEGGDLNKLNEVLNSYDLYVSYKKGKQNNQTIKWQKENGLGDEITVEKFIKFCRYEAENSEIFVNKKVAEIEEFLFEHYIFDSYCRCIKNGEIVDFVLFEKIKEFYLLCDNNANEFIVNTRFLEFKEKMVGLLSKNENEKKNHYQFKWDSNNMRVVDNIYIDEKSYSSRR